MKINLFSVALICFSVILFSCKQDAKTPSKAKTAQKATDGKKASTKKTGTKKVAKKGNKAKNSVKKLTEATYWSTAKKNLGLTDQQVNSVKNATKQFDSNVDKLKKAKKWSGDANKTTRTSMTKNHTDVIKRILGDKYSKWNKFAKNNKIKK